ncbi:uracil phosphoribosyltransferase [Paracoccidioides lutzii Pb01]|uniref:uracil phosphoribosyltransferase n=1 Tax=Paracoccidioides lutzii (strain ATCC MYA-826 / Pb01) TaxID=502779 RepID=C1H7A2_PARBA|nr:uracil phosphoribosyltransferase [Paracoccidioides lutzii Pb01]EEH35596.2 uracil phosphoribosyltransferase [Paracoccidioides lutzii Pb01]
MASSLPTNVHVSQHPCLRVKLSQLRSNTADSRQTSRLVNDISMILGCEALHANLRVTPSGTALTPLGYEYREESIAPENIALVPILRSGLGMVQAIQDLLPSPVAVHHLGLFREPTTLQPVEYYNNLPFSPSTDVPTTNAAAATLAIILDPIIATGGTCVAAIQTLKEWGVKKVLVISVLASEEGARRAVEEWPEGVVVWLGGVDPELDGKGMIKPGVGDVGDRLFLARGK